MFNNEGLVNQIGIEIKRIFGSKAMILLMVLLMLLSVAMPIIGKTEPKSEEDIGFDSMDGYENIQVNGVTVTPKSPLFWDVQYTNENIQYLSESALSDNDDLTLEAMKTILAKYVNCTKYIKTHDDYRTELAKQYNNLIFEKLIYENLDKFKKDTELNLGDYFHKSVDELEQYYELSATERLAKIDEIDNKIKNLDNIIESNNFQLYLKNKIVDLEDNITKNVKSIESLEKDIAQDPTKEEETSQQITQLKTENENLKKIDIPILQYKLDKEIPPGNDDWRNVALNDKQSALKKIPTLKPIPQKEFEDNTELKTQYKTYSAYQKSVENELNKETEKLMIAEKSVNAEKPDMKYVADGTRTKVLSYLWFSLVIAFLSVVISGGFIAREFQTGTIRLLLVRPKTRIKIALSKLFAVLIIAFVLYVAGTLLNVLSNGFMYGFSDLAFPNYTISSGAGGVSFFAYFVPKFLMCFVSVLFACAAAYLLSIVTRNTAIAVAIPLLLFVGALIVMSSIKYNSNAAWLAYTPVPYIDLSAYFINPASAGGGGGNYIDMPMGMNSGYMMDYTDYQQQAFQPKFGYGIPMMISMVLAMIGYGTWHFKNKDITN